MGSVFEQLWRQRRKTISLWNMKNKLKDLYNGGGAVLKLEI